MPGPGPPVAKLPQGQKLSPLEARRQQTAKTNNNKSEFWISLNRDSFDQAGIGRTKYIFGKSKFKIGEIVDCFFPNQYNQTLI